MIKKIFLFIINRRKERADAKISFDKNFVNEEV